MLCTLNILIGNKMVRYEGNLIFVEYSVNLHLVHLMYSNRAGNIITQNQIEICFN